MTEAEREDERRKLIDELVALHNVGHRSLWAAITILDPSRAWAESTSRTGHVRNNTI